MPPPVLKNVSRCFGTKAQSRAHKTFLFDVPFALPPTHTIMEWCQVPSVWALFGRSFRGFFGGFFRGQKRQKSEDSSGHGPSCKSWISSSQAHLAQGEPRGQTTGEKRSSVKIWPKSTKQSGTPSHSQSSEGIVTLPCKYQPPGGAL